MGKLPTVRYNEKRKLPVDTVTQTRVLQKQKHQRKAEAAKERTMQRQIVEHEQLLSSAAEETGGSIQLYA